MDNEWKIRTAKSEKLDRIIPAIAKGVKADRRANLACLCVPARRQEDIGYGV